MKYKKLIIMTVVALLLKMGSISNVYAVDKTYTSIRLGGQNRIETALKIANEYNNGNVQTVVVTTANNFPDALTGSVLAAKYNAPILLVNTTVKASQDVLDYIKSNLEVGGKVYILGGTSVVSTDIENNIKNMGYDNIKRLSGANRDETANVINGELNPQKGTPVFIATGYNFPDALAASGIAGIKGYPILLSSKDKLPQATIDSLSSIEASKVYIVGGTTVVSDMVSKQLESVTGLETTDIIRLSGTNRYETSLEIAKFFNINTLNAILATGADFPDALAGSSLAVKNNAPIILVSNDTSSQKKYLDSSTINNLIVLGGEGATKSSIVESFSEPRLLIDKINNKGNANQAIVVTTSSYSNVNATITTFENVNGAWKQIHSFAGTVGYNGFAYNKVEGDGRTPIGIFSLGTAFGRYGNPGTTMTYRQSNTNDYWVDDSQSALYNTWQIGPVNNRWSSAEKMYIPLYNYGFVINYNTVERVPGKGSAIFFHIWPGPGSPTAGCIAASQTNVVNVLKWLKPSKNPIIIQGPMSEVLKM